MQVEMWPVFDFPSEEWEADFSDVILQWDTQENSAAHVLAYTRRSETDAVIDTALGNGVLALICIVVMVVYMVRTAGWSSCVVVYRSVCA